MASFEDLNKTVTGMRNALVCRVCENPARPGKRQWYRCLKLHQICQDCKEKTECICGQPISLESCMIIEQLLSVEGLKFNCINTKNGCEEAFVENALKDHESECIYREVPCLYGKCSQHGQCRYKPSFYYVIQHYEELHNKVSFQDLSKLCTVKDCLSWDPFKCTFNNQTFVFCQKYYEKVEYKWVYILGSLNEAKHYSYTLKLIGKETETYFKGKVAAVDEPFETLLNAGKCLAIPSTVFAAQFLDEDEEFKYSLEIRNLKEEVKDENYESGISDNDEDSKE